MSDNVETPVFEYYNGPNNLVREGKSIAPYTPIDFIVDEETLAEAIKLHSHGVIMSAKEYKAMKDLEAAQAEEVELAEIEEHIKTLEEKTLSEDNTDDTDTSIGENGGQ